jgi:hypothetical protein
MSYFSELVSRNLQDEFDLCLELESKIQNLNPNPATDSEDASCPICMEDITDKNKTTTSCGHVFHSSCIFKNMMLRTSCPMCREDLVCKSIPSSNSNTTNTNTTNTNINININYNLSQTHSQLMDIDDDIINALLSQDILSQEIQYNEPPINNNDDNETVDESDSDANTDSDSDSQEESTIISGNSSVSVYDPSLALPTLADPDDDDESDGFGRFETDLTLSEVTNKMIELGYTPEDMFYYMTWRVNPFYFNMEYLNKYNDEFYDKMTETMHKIFTKEIPITTATSTLSQENIFDDFNSRVMTIYELN